MPREYPVSTLCKVLAAPQRLQPRVATRCSARKHDAPRCKRWQRVASRCNSGKGFATRRDALQFVAKRRCSLQHYETRKHALEHCAQRVATRRSELQLYTPLVATLHKTGSSTTQRAGMRCVVFAACRVAARCVALHRLRLVCNTTCCSALCIGATATRRVVKRHDVLQRIVSWSNYCQYCNTSCSQRSDMLRCKPDPTMRCNMILRVAT